MIPKGTVIWVGKHRAATMFHLYGCLQAEIGDSRMIIRSHGASRRRLHVQMRVWCNMAFVGDLLANMAVEAPWAKLAHEHVLGVRARVVLPLRLARRHLKGAQPAW